MSLALKACNDGWLGGCGQAGAPCVLPPTANLGNSDFDLRLPRVRENKLPPTEGKEIIL
jgi:hypothetical protein